MLKAGCALLCHRMRANPWRGVYPVSTMHIGAWVASPAGSSHTVDLAEPQK
jgi:hypothetical protein